jgi:polar amino acid transport system permease protein
MAPPRIQRSLLLSGCLFALLAVLCWQVFASVKYHWNWRGIWEFRGSLLKGWGLTLLISAGALVGSGVLGLALTAGQRSGQPALRWLCRAYVEIIRGTPLLTQLLIGYYIVADAMGLESKILAGIVLLTCFEGAYMAEMLRGGVESIEKSQWEAAKAVGFDRWQTWRFVILPQALRRVLPGIAGQGASLIKDSSLLSVIGIREFALSVDLAVRQTSAPLEGYLPMAAAYLALTLPLSWLARNLERRWRRP